MTALAGLLRLSAISSVVLKFATVAAVAEALSVVPAPVPPDGYYADTPTHMVFILVPNSNPAVKGIALQTGDTLAIILPKAFKRKDGVAIREDSDVNLTLTKGWPQAPVRQAGQYKIIFDEKTNAIGVRADTDIGTDGANSPGIKMIHLRGETFVNPVAGSYKVQVRLTDSNGKLKKTWNGALTVATGPMKGRVAPTNFHLGPNENADFQKIDPNEDALKMLGVLLWDGAGKPANGVGIAPADRARGSKYNYLLVKVSDVGKKLDAASGAVIGGVVLSGPSGARGQGISSPIGADGKPILSGEVVRSSKFPEAAGGGKPNAGLMPIVFHSGSKPGQYRLKIEVMGGNSTTYAFDVH